MHNKHVMARLVALTLAMTVMSLRAFGGEYTIYFYNDKGWPNVSVWVWDENDIG